MEVIQIFILIFGGITITFFGGLLFTNAIEYLAHKAKWTGSFTGAVISPIFTSMPELIIFLVALYIYGGDVGEKIGVGTIFGQPFMAATIIFPVMFLVVLFGYVAGKRNDLVLEVERNLVIPYIVFTALYPVVLLPLLPIGIGKYFASIALFLSYIFYVYTMFKAKATIISEAEDIYLRGLLNTRNGLWILVTIQLAIALTLLIIGSRSLVSGIGEVSKNLNVSPIALAILLTPLAGILPEAITAIIWAFKGKDTLAVAAMIGEKVLFSTFYPAIGLILTEWEIDISAIVSVIVVEIVSLIILYHVSKGKLTLDVAGIGLGGYIVFAIYIFYIK